MSILNCRKRSNLSLLAGITVFVVAIWFSFLLGTLYASHFEDKPRTINPRNIDDSRSDGGPPRQTGCSCSDSENNKIVNEQNNENSDDKSEGLVLVDKKPQKKVTSPSDHGSSEVEENGMIRMSPQAVLNDLDLITSDSNITVKHENYHLTWTSVEETLTTVFSAYYDDRPAMYGPSIVLPGYQHKKYHNGTLYCLYRYKDGTTQCSAPKQTKLMEMDACNTQKEFDKKRERQFLHVFHICRLHDSTPPGGTADNDQPSNIPTHVALSPSTTCQPSTSFIPVYHYRPKYKIEFGVCIQTPAFGKSPQDFVSFIELYKMLGAQFFTLYVLNIDELTLSYLHRTYGGDNGILDIVQWTDQLNEKEPIHYYGEILAIHDCLYRNMHRIKYLAFVDLDEALIPRRYPNWREMLREIDRPYVDSFIFPNSIFMKTEQQQIDENLTKHWQSQLCNRIEPPIYFTNFNRVKCVFNYFSRSKLMVKPELIVDADIHGVCTRVGNTTHYLVPEDSAVSQHYRTIPTIECRKNRKTRKYPSRHDDWMVRYADPLLKKMSKRLCKYDS